MTVNAGALAIVTFIDAVTTGITGFVQVCKVAGAGITVGTNFTFNVAGTPETVAAGPAPGGTCGTPVTAPIGNAVITETIPAGTIARVASAALGKTVTISIKEQDTDREILLPVRVPKAA